MLEIRPVVVVGIGPQSRRTVQRYVRSVRTRQGAVPAVLPVIVDYSDAVSPFRSEDDGVQRIVLSSPVFQSESEWPTWLPLGLEKLSSVQRGRTRSWMRAALLREADELQEFLLESIPRLSSFAAVEALDAMGLRLAGSSEIDVYVIADLNDPLGSGIFVDVAYLTSYVCQQLGLVPLTLGMLYLPSAVSPAPMEEAQAYAALKELEYYVSGHPYSAEFASESALARDVVPFNQGCCLLDSVNEAGYTLQDDAQLIAAVSERLYAMTFLDMATEARERRARRYQTATLRRKSRAFESFGIVIRYVPHELLVDWGAARLGGDVVDRILNAQSDADPEKRTQAFIGRIGLRFDSLEDSIRYQDGGEYVTQALAPLYRTGLKQIELRSRQVLQTIRREYLPVLDDVVTRTGTRRQQEVKEALVEEVRITLEDLPVGGIALVGRFLDLLHDRVSAMEEESLRLSKGHQRELSRSLGTVSQSYYTLRSVAMSIPPWPISVLSVIALLVLPLVYGIQLVLRTLWPVSEGWSLLALGTLTVGALGVLGFVIYRLARQRKRVCAQHAHMVLERFELESKPLISRAMGAICKATHEAISQAKAEMDVLVDRLETITMQFRESAEEDARVLVELTRPGPFRSVADPERAERFYRRAIPDLDRTVASLTQEIGSIADWQDRCVRSPGDLVPWLHDQIWLFGARHLEPPFRQIEVADALTIGASEDEVCRIVERMFEYAYPLWNYDPRLLTRAKTQRLDFLGVDANGSAWAKLVGPVAKAHPNVIPIDTPDPSTLVVLIIHRGVPLFALRRIGQYRLHYAEAIWQGKLPVHSARDFALVDDLIPVRRKTRLAAATLFAVGLALGIIHRDPDDRYIVPRGQGRTVRLSPQKELSVALVSLEATICREVQRQLDTLVTAQGREAVCAILDEYLTGDPGLEDWEVKHILSFSQDCGF